MKWDLGVWNKRYKQPQDKTIEDTMVRVASAMATGPWENKFADFLHVLTSGYFIPGGRILANAGTPGGMLLNCFNIPVMDSRHDIFRSLTDGIEVLAHGGGVGFNFSNLRPAGAPLKSTGGQSQGPIPFIDIFDQCFQLISKSYDKRQAAAIALLSVDHPDVLAFIDAKKANGTDGAKRWPTMNISVDMTEGFSDQEKWKAIVDSVYECGDPGLTFLHHSQDDNNLDPKEHPITGVNPCGEVPLMDYGACCLGSINLSRLVQDSKMNYEELAMVVKSAVEFLTSVLVVTKYPGPAFEATSKKYRRIGLGVTGLAHTLIKMNLTYGSKESLAFVEQVMMFIATHAYGTSGSMALEFGESVPLRVDGKGFYHKVWPENQPLYHSGLMAIAPTGSTSMLARTSSGIEPLFSLEVNRTDRGVDKVTKDPLLETGEYPLWLFKTAMEVLPSRHLAMLETVQRWVDGSVSKTINVPENMDRSAFNLFMYEAVNSGVIKGMTVYRDKSLPEQVVVLDQPIQEGKIYEIPTPSGKVYVPIAWDKRGNIKQVFIHLNKPGGEEFAFASALGRVISVALQEGASVDRIIETLEGIGGGRVLWTTIRGKSVAVLSTPDAVAKVLADHVGREDILNGNRQDDPARVSAPTVVLTTDQCQKCREPLTRKEGCKSGACEL
jgi:ribonucleoside-diphosphate reductase alpha chain